MKGLLDTNHRRERSESPIPAQAQIWEMVTQPGASDQQWNGIAYGNGIFVACSIGGSTETAIMTSPDGINWTSRVVPVITALAMRRVVFGNGMFVIGCSAGFVARLLYSPDGINWTAATVPVLQSFQVICFGNGMFVAMSTGGAAGGRVMTSPDGINWTLQSNPTPAGDINWEGVCYGNGLFVAVASTGADRVMTSPDGITWTVRDTGVCDAIGWRRIAYGNGLFVAVGTPDASNNAIMTSRDGITWVLRAAPVAGGGGSYFSVVYALGTWIAVGSGSTNSVIRSTDGLTWRSITTNPSTGQSYLSVAYGNGMFIAVANSGTNRIAISGRSFFSSETYPFGQTNNYSPAGWTFAQFVKLRIPTSVKIANAGGRIKEFFADAGNVAMGETDLFSYSTEAGMLSANGQSISGKISGSYVGVASLIYKLYFGGQLFFDSAAQVDPAAGAWSIHFTIIRVSATVLRCITNFSSNIDLLTVYTELTALDLTIANILKVTGQSDTASNDIIAKMGVVEWSPASI